MLLLPHHQPTSTQAPAPCWIFNISIWIASTKLFLYSSSFQPDENFFHKISYMQKNLIQCLCLLFQKWEGRKKIKNEGRNSICHKNQISVAFIFNEIISKSSSYSAPKMRIKIFYSCKNPFYVCTFYGFFRYSPSPRFRIASYFRSKPRQIRLWSYCRDVCIIM